MEKNKNGKSASRRQVPENMLWRDIQCDRKFSCHPRSIMPTQTRKDRKLWKATSTVSPKTWKNDLEKRKKDQMKPAWAFPKISTVPNGCAFPTTIQPLSEVVWAGHLADQCDTAWKTWNFHVPKHQNGLEENLPEPRNLSDLESLKELRFNFRPACKALILEKLLFWLLQFTEELTTLREIITTPVSDLKWWFISCRIFREPLLFYPRHSRLDHTELEGRLPEWWMRS